jgi:hypothetical protein
LLPAAIQAVGVAHQRRRRPGNTQRACPHIHVAPTDQQPDPATYETAFASAPVAARAGDGPPLTLEPRQGEWEREEQVAAMDPRAQARAGA